MTGFLAAFWVVQGVGICVYYVLQQAYRSGGGRKRRNRRQDALYEGKCAPRFDLNRCAALRDFQENFTFAERQQALAFHRLVAPFRRVYWCGGYYR